MDPFEEEIHRLLKDDPGVRVREAVRAWDHDRERIRAEVRPFYLAPRTFSAPRIGRGRSAQFDLWHLAAMCLAALRQPNCPWVHKLSVHVSERVTKKLTVPLAVVKDRRPDADQDSERLAYEREPRPDWLRHGERP